MNINDTTHWRVPDVVTEIVVGLEKGIKMISLTAEEEEHLHAPWKFSLIIKLIGKRIVHHYMKTKIQDLWKPSENLPLINLGSDYYIVKFSREGNMINVLNKGP